MFWRCVVLFANERQNKIYEIIQRDGAVTASGLGRLFGVSTETIRRDLLVMERGSLLTRVHGGAVAKSDMKPFLRLKERSGENTEKKYELSKKAMEFISDGDIIGVDCGSTAIAFAEVLKERFQRLTVVTHSADVFEILRSQRDFSVILCGGCYLSDENAFCGALTVNMLDSLHLKKAFIFPSAVSLKYGIADFQPELYTIQKKLISAADEVFILADSSKLEKTALLRISEMKPEYRYVTDSELNKELLSLYSENGINIYL